jgi:hypothetical protein
VNDKHIIDITRDRKTSMMEFTENELWILGTEIESISTI